VQTKLSMYKQVLDCDRSYVTYSSWNILFHLLQSYSLIFGWLQEISWVILIFLRCWTVTMLNLA